MGDIADMMLDGDLCEGCGVYLEGGDGYARKCGSCKREEDNPPSYRKQKRALPKHLCHAYGCDRQVHPKFFMCPPHWQMLSVGSRRLIWKHYKPGQESAKNPSKEYLAAALAARDEVDRSAKENSPNRTVLAKENYTSLPKGSK